MGEYPYIADKKLYAATMFACRMIRQNGYFNKDCRIAADYYGLDEDDVAEQVRLRQSAGQHGKKRGKMKWFVVREGTSYCAGDHGTWNGVHTDRVHVMRGKNKKTVESIRKSSAQICDEIEDGAWTFRRVMAEFDTKAEAESALYDLARKARKDDGEW